MNTSIIRYLLGHILKIEGILILLPCLVALIYGENEGFSYLLVSLVALFAGIILTIRKPNSTVFYLKEGCIATALSWILLSLVGAIPFYLTGEIPSFINALFETVSGFTTTGASILNDVEALSHASLMWRSFTHWIGGMGVLVFLLAILPMAGGSNMNLMRAESPGPTVGKLVPKVATTARLLYIIYIGMTILQIVLLLFGDMPLFDAVTTAFGTAGTGGFGIKNDSLGGYSPYIQWVVTIFMILFGVNFNAYYLIIFGKLKKALCMEEIRGYFAIIFASAGFIAIQLLQSGMVWFDSVRHSLFQVASIITTTGYATMDFDLWTQSSKMVLVLLMFIGACAGSTGGGLKVSRILILIKTIYRELSYFIHPRSVRKLKMDDKLIEHEVVRSTNVYFITFIILFVASVFALSFEGHDFTTNFTAVAATINNIGPGLEMVGPTCNFGFFTPFSKIVLMLDMLIGRLELFPMLLLFHPIIWKEMVSQKLRHRRLKKEERK